ncbi:hypothetical protein BHE74_00043976 [Ensete ventricosum]|nr:hypothetical protein BHE74_00043976 [Ensete ventricosum]
MVTYCSQNIAEILHLRCVAHCKNNNTFCRWFAKRFLHPDIVAPYKYVFLWDEDLEVENFHPEKSVFVLHHFFVQDMETRNVGRTDGPRLLKSCLELCMAYDSSLLKCFSSLCSHAFPNYSSLTGLTHKIVLDRYLLIGLLPTTDMQ